MKFGFFTRNKKLTTGLILFATIMAGCLFLTPSKAYATCTTGVGPDYCGIPLDILGAPYSDAPYSSGYITNPESEAQNGFYGAGGSPSISLFDGNDTSSNPGPSSAANCNLGGRVFEDMERAWVYSEIPGQGSQDDGNSVDGQTVNPSVGQSTIPMGFENMEYACYQAVSGSVHGPVNAPTDSDTTILPNGSYLSHNSNFYVYSVSASTTAGGGSAGNFSCLVGQTSSIAYQSATRYRYPTSTGSAPGCSSGNGFNFTLNKPFVNITQTVTINIQEYGTATFYNQGTKGYTTYDCIAGDVPVDSPNVPPNLSDPGDQCSPMSITLNVEIVYQTQPPKISLNATGSCIAGTPTVTLTASDPINPSGDPVTGISLTGPNGIAASQEAVAGYVYDVSPWNGFTSNTFTASASDQAGTSTQTISIGPCGGGLTCGTTLSQVTVGQPFGLVTSINYSGVGQYGSPPDSGGTYDVGVSGGVYPYKSVPYKVGSDVENKPISLTIGTAGNYIVTWEFSDNGITSTPTPCTDSGSPLSAVYKPYMQVTGGDVASGSEFQKNGVCSGSAPSSNVIGWNQDSTPSYTGAGTSYAIYALMHIAGFASDQANSTGPGSTLSFANTNGGITNPSLDEFGGNFGAVSCSSDYYSQKPGGATPLTSVSPLVAVTGLSVNNLSPGSFAYTDPLSPLLTPLVINGGTIQQTGLPHNGVKATLYVNGDVYINGNITYAGTSTWSSISNIPDFKLIVCGNIYISHQVSEIDGEYIAQNQGTNCNNPSAGNIYTCMDQAVILTDTFIYPGNSSCSQNQLNVVGAFVSNSTYYSRAYGNLFPDNSFTIATPGELFNYSPEVWLPDLNSNQPGYSSIVSLPPVL